MLTEEEERVLEEIRRHLSEIADLLTMWADIVAGRQEKNQADAKPVSHHEPSDKTVVERAGQSVIAG